ncbi:hypothetical protein FBR02_02760 [Anaerolineae bacterium CFX9]|nr:hypothetical protein [Anaerolineae bacterium CFX9]
MREMSMLYSKDISVNSVRIQEAMRHASNERLAREARGGKKRVLRFYAPLMVSIGRQLIAVGASLQSRYADALRERHAAEVIRATGEYALSRRG